MSDSGRPLEKRQLLFPADICVWTGLQNPDDDISICLELLRLALLQANVKRLVPLPRLSSSSLMLPSFIFLSFSHLRNYLSLYPRIASVLDVLVHSCPCPTVCI